MHTTAPCAQARRVLVGSARLFAADRHTQKLLQARRGLLCRGTLNLCKRAANHLARVVVVFALHVADCHCAKHTAVVVIRTDVGVDGGVHVYLLFVDAALLLQHSFEGDVRFCGVYVRRHFLLSISARRVRHNDVHRIVRRVVVHVKRHEMRRCVHRRGGHSSIAARIACFHWKCRCKPEPLAQPALVFRSPPVGSRADRIRVAFLF